MGEVVSIDRWKEARAQALCGSVLGHTWRYFPTPSALVYDSDTKELVARKFMKLCRHCGKEEIMEIKV